MSDTPLPLTRRAALGSTGLGLAALAGLTATTAAGCRWGPPASVPAGEEQEDVDQELVDGVVTRIVAARDVVAAASATHTGLATPLAPLTGLHAAHLTALHPVAASPSASPSTPGPSATTPGAASATSALAQVRREETALQKSLAAAAGRATSGPLARTLASMAAAVAMHTAALPRTAGAA